jgi:hypothetical protein
MTSNQFLRTSSKTSPIISNNNNNNNNNSKAVCDTDIKLDDIGMTKERQIDIENKLYNMLGDNNNTKNNHKSINQPPPSSSPPLIALNNIDISGEWTCQVCTLINSSSNIYCTMCSTKK